METHGASLYIRKIWSDAVYPSDIRKGFAMFGVRDEHDIEWMEIDEDVCRFSIHGNEFEFFPADLNKGGTIESRVVFKDTLLDRLRDAGVALTTQSSRTRKHRRRNADGG